MAKLSVPKPGVNEQELRQIQLEAARGEAELAISLNDLVESQMGYYQAMEPIYLKENGLEKVTDPETGKATYNYVGDGGLRENALEIERLSQERTLKGLKGELPVSPGLERDIQESGQQLDEQLFRNLGQGYETSTPGMYAQAQHTQRASELREADRRGEIAGANALTLATQNVRATRQGADPFVGNFTQGAQAIGAGASTFGAVGANAGNYQSPYQFDRNLQFQKNLTKYGAKKELQGALIGGGMQLGSQLIGSAAGSMSGSHPSLKKDVTAAPEKTVLLQRLLDIVLKEYTFNDDEEGVRHVGWMTTEAHETLATPDLMKLDLQSVFGTIVGAIQAQDERLTNLEREWREEAHNHGSAIPV